MNTDEVTSETETLLSTAAELYGEVVEAIAHDTVEAIARQWLSKATMEIDDELYARTLDLAADLEAFAPSSLGNSTAFDRLARRRSVSAEETAALAMIKAARMAVFLIDEVADDGFGFGASDLLDGTQLTILDPEISPEARDTRVFGRLGALPDGRFWVIGPITPLDDAGMAVAIASISKSKSAAQDHRCAAAVFKHVARHGNPTVVGLNSFPEGEEGEEGLDPLSIAALVLSEGKLTPKMAEGLEAEASIDSVIEALYRAHAATGELGPKLATGYVALAGLQLRALERRFASGDGTRRPLDQIGEAIDWEVEHHDYPAQARTLFSAMRDDVLAEQAAAAAMADTPINGD